VEAVRGEDLEGDVEELAATFVGGEADVHGGHTVRPFAAGARLGPDGGTGPREAEVVEVATRPSRPAAQTTRPPEPIRPLPAERTGVSLLALKVRRRRHRDGLPKQGGLA
jgi:hypothetical protein